MGSTQHRAGIRSSAHDGRQQENCFLSFPQEEDVSASCENRIPHVNTVCHVLPTRLALAYCLGHLGLFVINNFRDPLNYNI